MARRVLGVLVAVIALAVIIGFFLPRNVHVERSTVIEAPPATLYTMLNGYSSFNRWSPWYSLDPQAVYTYEGPPSGPGARMSWTSRNANVGSGSQTILESRPRQMIKSELDFGPKGKALSAFQIAPEGSGARVTWGMDVDMGAGPVGRYFGLLMDGKMGKDFEKGLAALKTYAEGLPKVDFSDLKVEDLTTSPVTVACVSAASSTDPAAIGAAIGAAYMKIGAFMKANGLSQAGAPMTITTRWDDTGYGFDAAIPIDRAPATPAPEDSPVKIRQTYAGRALKVVHSGSYAGLKQTYDKLGACMAAMGLTSAGPPWEEYVTDPGNTPEADLRTNIYMPVK